MTPPPAKPTLLQRVLNEGGNLPVARQVLERFSQICNDPRASAKDLADVLQTDTGLTSRILKMVNSSFYGLSSTIKTVTHAIVVLGFQEVKNIALSVPVAGFYQKNLDRPGLNINKLWTHTVETACLSRVLARHAEYDVPEQVFVMAIIRNIGMVAINNVLGREYLSLVQESGSKEEFPEIEKEKLSFSHCEVGAAMARRWHYPQELVDFIEDHHDPVKDGQVLIEPALVRAARRFLQGLATGQTVETLLEDLPPEMVEALHLTPEVVTSSAEKAQADFEEAKGMLKT